MDSATLHLIIEQAPTAILALVFLYLFLAGKVHSASEYSRLEAERDYWRETSERLSDAASTERKTSTELAQAGTVTNQLISAITQIASGPSPPARRRRPPRELTGEDTGP